MNEWAAPELDCDAGSGERNAAVHLLPPEKFAPFVVPFKRDAGLAHATAGNPYLVPGEYTRTVERNVKAVTDLRREVKQASLEDLTRNDLQTCIQAHFKDWLVSTGKMRQVYGEWQPPPEARPARRSKAPTDREPFLFFFFPSQTWLAWSAGRTWRSDDGTPGGRRPPPHSPASPAARKTRPDDSASR